MLPLVTSLFRCLSRRSLPVVGRNHVNHFAGARVAQLFTRRFLNRLGIGFQRFHLLGHVAGSDKQPVRISMRIVDHRGQIDGLVERPRKLTLPLWARVSPMIERTVVVLPMPLRPRSATASPWLICIEKPKSTWLAP